MPNATSALFAHNPPLQAEWRKISKSFGGSGLGMTIVHNLVTTVLQGHVHVESKLGQGTAIHLTFPQTRE